MKQPFAVSLTSNVLMIMVCAHRDLARSRKGTIFLECTQLQDFHCHLDLTEVVGYLGGRYDRASRSTFVSPVIYYGSGYILNARFKPCALNQVQGVSATCACK